MKLVLEVFVCDQVTQLANTHEIGCRDPASFLRPLYTAQHAALGDQLQIVYQSHNALNMQIGESGELAEAYHLNRHTVAKWRQRKGVEDASHRPAAPRHGPGSGGGSVA